MSLTVEDKLEIMELASAYNHALDHHRAEEWAEVFTETGLLRSGGKLRAQGRVALAAQISKAKQDGYQYRHWTSNILIEGSGDKARLRMYVMSINVSNGIAPYIMAEYDDIVVKVNGKWLFEERNVHPCVGKPYFAGGMGARDGNGPG